MTVMTVNLTKGDNVNLSKMVASLKAGVIGLGWNARQTDGPKFDLDASAVLCGPDGKAIDGSHFVFYNNKKDPSGAVSHQGDNQTGDGDGDDEMIFVDFTSLPAHIDKVVVLVSIDKAEERKQTFGDVSGAYVRFIDAETEEVLAKYDLREDASKQTALIFAEVYRYEGDWKMRAIGEGFNNGLAGVITAYGLNG